MQTDDRRAADLEELGLTNYEARVYLALIRRDVFTAAEVAREAGVPRQRVYDVLEGLIRRQLAMLHPGRVAGYSAVAPETAVERLIEQQRRSLGRLERLSSELARELKPTYDSGRTHTDPLDYVEVLRDPADIAERFARMQTTSEGELLSFCKPPWITPPENTAGLEASARLHAAGRTVRSLYTREVLEDPRLVEVMHLFVEAGEEVRIADDLPLKMIISDGSTVLCDMPDPVARDGATTTLCIRHPSLAAALATAFRAIWEESPTLTEALKEAQPEALEPPAATSSPADAGSLEVSNEAEPDASQA
ncbi:TrmB family transcriptional regulator [Streptacidiphilus rugosus]|uniref:TrmB family transcriptional regulator n=1 Tax=Streptacidiphilus rugosus TaxID=405783 RepID=UPI0007C82454|nr:helix-turn-helix domain-containing protein [Streptacidiphilus rugosus]